ncbi:MAG: TonB-dependent receptor plug domain-containing protein [Chlorobiota bacterium]
MNYAEVLLCLSVFFISTNMAFSTNSIDSLVKPNDKHGLLLNDSSNHISKREIQEINYTTLFDILNNEGNFMPLGLGINGRYNNFFSYGDINTNPSVLFNGRSLNSNVNNKFNLEVFSPEFLENIEILKGSASAILSPVPNSTSLNLQEIKYNTKTPFTRLWYSQEGGSFIGVDGIFSQNFAEGWNFTFGFKKIDDQLNYENMSSDLWNLRAIVRYNIDSNSSISLSDNFTNNKIITSGGVNPNESVDIYSAINSNQFFERIQDRNYRHDVNLTYTGKFGGFKILNTAFVTTNEQIYELPDSFYPDTTFDATYDEFIYGNRLDLEYEFSNIKIKSGGSISNSSSDSWLRFNNLDQTHWNLYSMMDLNFSNELKVSGGLNLGSQGGNSFIGFGENISYSHESFKLYLDHSYFTRNSNYIQLIEDEITNLFILGFKNDFGFEIEGYYRNTTNPILFSLTDDIYFERNDVGNYSALGGHIKFSSDLFDNIFSKTDELSMNILSKFNYILDNENLKEFYPLAFIQGSINYKLIVNQSELNLGARGGLLTSKSSPRFIPVSNIYTLTDITSNMQTTGLTLYTFMRLGNAVVKLDFENVLNAGYYYISFYPERGQILKLSVAWSFFD